MDKSRTDSALCLVLAAPLIFAVLATLEEPKNRVNDIRHGSRLLGTVGWHWLTRCLHVIGAAVVFGAAFHVISNGYPQTLMVPFGKLPEDVRWALVKLVSEKLTTGAVSEKSR